jgi:hypothetical protein
MYVGRAYGPLPFRFIIQPMVADPGITTLGAKPRESSTQWRGRNLNQTRVRRVHLQYQKYRTGNGERGYEQASDCGRVERCKEAKTNEKSSDPESQNDEERHGHRAESLFIYQPTCLSKGHHDTHRLGLHCPLRVVFRREFLYFVGENFSARGPWSQLERACRVFRPHLIENADYGTVEQLASFHRVRPIMRQHPVQKDYLR